MGTQEKLGPGLLTIRQAAKQLAVCGKTLRRAIDRGELAVVRLGDTARADRIDPEDLKNYTNKARNGASVAIPSQGKQASEHIKLGVRTNGIGIRRRGRVYYTDFSVSGTRYVRSLKTTSRSEAIAKACALRASLLRSPVEFVSRILGSKGVYPAWDYSEPWARKAWQQASHRAKKRAIPFDLTIEDLKSLADRSGGVCALTRLPFVVDGDHPGYRANPFTPSLDRVSAQAGYTRGNVRLICLCVNVALNQWGEGVFSLMAKGYVKALLDHWSVSPEIVLREGE